jgi:sulfite exporter TauE/SafE
MGAETGLGALFLVGLLGSGHCMGMCGGISASLGAAQQQHPMLRLLNTILFNLGRILTYCLLGLLLGSALAEAREWLLPLGRIMRYVAGLMLILIALSIANWWQGVRRIESVGQFIWRPVRPLVRHLMPPDNPARAATLGLIWGLLPCGLVYSTLALALANDQQVPASMGMLAFGLGTLPAMLATGLAASGLRALVQRRHIRQGAAILMIGFGLWTLPGPHQMWIMQHILIPSASTTGKPAPDMHHHAH